MTTAIYVRVSTDEQAVQGYSIDMQKERLIAYCASQGWTDYKLYIDDGYTGTNLNRPAMNKMLRHIEDGKLTGVIVYKLDRLGRKQKDVLFLLEDIFEKRNIIFKSATEPFETSTPFGKAMIGVLTVFAQLERDMIVERTTSGRRQKADKGLWYGGRIPFGYSLSKESKLLEIVPEEAHIIREIFKMYLQGQSRLAIAEWASNRSKARVFDHNVIRDMLTRHVYAGKLLNSGKIVKGQHEAIVQEEVWNEVQNEMTKRLDGAAPMGDFLLTGLLSCGVCGSGIVHVKRVTNRNGKVYSYELYACKNQHIRYKDRTNTCSLGYRRREDVESFIIDRIKEVALNPKLAQSLLDRRNDEPESNEVLKTSVQSKLMTINEGLDNLYEAIQTGEIKASAVSPRIKKLEEEREALELQLEDIEDKKPGIQQTPQQAILQICEIGAAWDYLTEDEQKQMIRKILIKITLHKDSDPEIQWNISI